MTALLGALGGLSALIYAGHYCHAPCSWAGSAIKTIAVAALAGIAAAWGAPTLLVMALGLSAVGDLALSRPGSRAFLAGLCAFALVHLAYILVFAGLGAGAPPLLPALLLGAYALSTEIWLITHTGHLRWPVRAYVLLIAGMALAAMGLPGAPVGLWLGAGAFLLSDTLLAIQTFRLRPDSAAQRALSPLLWLLYYAAQGLILFGVAG